MQARIAEIIPETKDIASFRLVPEKPLNYLPGQWMYVRLTPELKHHFTISSSPTENFLQFTTKFRLESEYKQALWKLQVGDTVEINGPFGSFCFDQQDVKPKLFIAGGIGITPFRSMLTYITAQKIVVDVKLLYSVKTKSEAAFPDLPSTTLIETTTQGHLDAAKIKQLVPDWQNRTWWLCGPPAMVEAFVELTTKLGLPPAQVKSEEFTGY